MVTSTDNDGSLKREPLFEPIESVPLWQRLALLGVWCLLVAWLASKHVVWRDEARAFAFATSGETVSDMLRIVQGEGHPALWYLVLRAAHAMTGARVALQGAGLLVGFLAAALFVLKAPFRLWVLFVVLFSTFFVVEFTVVARNYGLAALLMFAIAAWWERIKDSACFGLLLFLLCNVNVPSVVLAGALFLFRALEVLETNPRERPGEWRRLALNALLAAAGALAAFVTVYPPANDAAVGLEKHPLTPLNFMLAFVHTKSFSRDLGLPGPLEAVTLILLAGSIAVFARHRRALIVALLSLVTLKFFFFFIYLAYLRHVAMLLVFLLALAWIVHKEAPANSPKRIKLETAGKWMLVLLLAIQTVTLLRKPLADTAKGVPFSRAAELAEIMERPGLRNSVLIVDGDMLGESVVYYRRKPTWLLRQSRFGVWAPFKKGGRELMTLADMLAEARMLHERTGQPVVIAIHRRIHKDGLYRVMFQNLTLIEPEGRRRFLAETRHIASLRPAQTDEEYDVFLYPR
jgi:hypothetical protein